MRDKGIARARRPDYPQIGDRLRVRRRELGLSLRDLAERLGVSPSLISQIERGRASREGLLRPIGQADGDLGVDGGHGRSGYRPQRDAQPRCRSVTLSSSEERSEASSR